MDLKIIFRSFTVLFLVIGSGNCNKIVLGGLFDEVEDGFNVQQVSFEHAVEMLRMENKQDADQSLNEQGEGQEGEVEASATESDQEALEIETIIQNYPQKEKSSFLAQNKLCEMFSEGVTAIFGPQYGDSSPIIQAICDAKDIPHIQMRWDTKQRVSSCLVNLYPFPKTLAKAFADLIRAWKWKKFTIIYENSESFTRIEELLKSKNNGNAKVKVRQLDKGNNFRPMLRAVKDAQDTNIVLDCSTEKLREVLKQAQQVGLMGSEHSFIITNLDLHTIDLEPYQYSGTNITGMSMYNIWSQNLYQTAEKLTEFTSKGDNARNFTANDIPVEAALMYDAVSLLSIALRSNKLEIVPTPCNSSENAGFGSSIINYLKVTQMKGLTGFIKFDQEGFRSDVEFFINELTADGLALTGMWNITTGIRVFDRKYDDTPATQIRDLRNVTFTVITSLTKPYAMRRKSVTRLEGNDQYEGYCIDLIRDLSEISGFKYKFIIQEDKQSGNPVKRLANNSVQWDGMIGAVLDYRADLALADITITGERENAVDFANPYMDLGIAILYKKPQKEPAGFFSFLSPFRVEVWIYVVTAYLTVSLLFFIMARISPYEWRNPYPCVQEPEELENQFTLSNSFWFTIGALMQQGSDIAPVSMSTRLAAGVWWFFTLIMVSSYTANLAAFLSVENPETIISNVEELANQHEIKYGAKINGSTFNFFKDSKKLVYVQMYNYMVAHPDVMTKNSEEGVFRAETENYAFLMESTSIEYETERRCGLNQIGKPLDSKGYGIAMRKGSWYFSTISQHILKLQEKGKLAYLKRKWWNEKYAGACEDDEGGGDAETLGMQNVGGVFVVLIIGIAISIPIAVMELILYVWNVSAEENISFKDRLLWEVKFFLRCHGSTKPATLDQSEESSDK